MLAVMFPAVVLAAVVTVVEFVGNVEDAAVVDVEFVCAGVGVVGHGDDVPVLEVLPVVDTVVLA